MKIPGVSAIILAILVTISQSFSLEQLTKTMEDINHSPLVNLMMIYDSAAENGQMIEKMMQQISANKEGYFKMVFIDCEKADKDVTEGFQYCGDEIRKQLPALIFTEPALNQKNPDTMQWVLPANIQYQGALTEKSLYDFATPLMKAFSQNIRKMSDWNRLLDKFKNEDLPVVMHCTNKQTLSPFYKAVTANFRNRAVFAHVLPNAQGQNPICTQFGVEKYPALLLNGEEQIKLSSNLKEMLKTMQKYVSSKEKEKGIYIEESIEQAANEISAAQMEEVIYQQPKHILVHIAGPKGESHSRWEELQKTFKKMFVYYEGEGAQMIKQVGVKKAPAIVYYPKSLAKKQIQKTIFTEGYTYQQIYEELSELVGDFTVPCANNLELQQMAAISLKDDKLVVVLFHSQDIPLPYKMLSNHEDFKESMTFFRMKDPEQQVMVQFQVKKLPALFIMSIDDRKEHEQNPEGDDDKKGANLKLAQFTGKFNYDQLYGYLSHFTSKPTTETQDTFQKQVTKISNAKSFKRKCLSDFCYLLLLNGAPANQEKNDKAIQEFQKISARVAPSDNLVSTDAVCHAQLLQSLQIQEDQLPTVVYMNPKFQKYTRLIGRIEEKSLAKMAAKVKANKSPYRPYSKISFQDRKCDEVHAKLKELSEQNHELNEEQAAFLEEIKREEEEKRKQTEEQVAKLVKDDGKKKKKKKKRPRRDWEEGEDL